MKSGLLGASSRDCYETQSATLKLDDLSLFENDGPRRGWRRKEIDIVGFLIACGQFIGITDVDREKLQKPGRALLPRGIPYAPGMFGGIGLGGSMLPRIPDGSWLFFHPKVVGTRQDRLVLVEDQNQITGPRYTVKKYHSEKIYSEDGTWRHGRILLFSLNADHPPIPLEPNGNYRIRGWYVGCTSQVERVDEHQFPDAAA